MLRDLLRLQRSRYRVSNAAGLVLPPNPTSISPATGPVGGGTPVTILGNHLGGTTSVTFGGVAATNITNVNDGRVTCTTPVGSLGPAVDVAITTRAGTGVLSAAFLYTGAAPTFASVWNLIGAAVGDIDGGYTVTITGTNFVVGGTTVTFGGVSATSVVVSSATTLTCTVPAHASGLVNVVVTTAGGSATGVNAWEYFSPAQQSMSAWWREFTGSAPWAATASAGSSAATGALVTGGSDPTAGAALNGHGVAHFDGAANFLTNPTTAQGNVWALGSGLIVALVKFNSESAPTGNYYDDRAIIEDTNYDCGLTVTTSGAVGFGYDGAYEITTPAPLSTGAYHFVMMRWNGSTVGITIDTGAEVTHALGTITIMNGPLIVGRWAAGAAYAAMELVELMCATATVSNAVRDKFRSYFATRYGVAV